MENVSITWCGAVLPNDTIRAAATSRIGRLTDECRDRVQAWVHVQPTSTRAKIPFTFRGRLYLAVIECDYLMVVDMVYLNIRQLIFMIDNTKVVHTQLPFNFSVILDNLDY